MVRTLIGRKVIMKLFSKEKVNTGRQLEVDLAKGIAGLLIIICHVGFYLGNPDDAGLFYFSDIIGSEWGAPVFIAMMGVGLIYVKDSSPKKLLKRGLLVFLVGYALSLYRALIPYLIFGEINWLATVESFFVVDIFQLAGLSLMLLSLLKKIKIPTWGVLLLSAVMVLAGQYFIANMPITDNKYLIPLLDLFIPVSDRSCFPFLTWFFFVPFGMAFGEALIRCNNKNKLYGILLPISLAGVAFVYYQFHNTFPEYAENYYYGGNFYYMGLVNVLLTLCFITCMLSLLHFASKVLPKFVTKFIEYIGRNITIYYVFTWIFIGAIIHIVTLCNITFSRIVAIVLMVVLIALCVLCTKLFNHLRKKD